jgi:protein involved in ribonucleotide reduction
MYFQSMIRNIRTFILKQILYKYLIQIIINTMKAEMIEHYLLITISMIVNMTIF